MIEQLDLQIIARRKVRFVRQAEIAECGLACIAMIAGYHGLDVNLQGLRGRFTPSARGVTLRSLISTADQLGLSARAVRLEPTDLKALAKPSILHWDLNHFVVLERISGKHALIHDPAIGIRRLSMDELSRHFTGVALELHPSAEFQTGEFRQRLTLNALWSRITGVRRALAQTVLLSLLIQAFVLISPYYLQLSIDSALPELNIDLLSVLAIGFGLVVLLNAIATLLRASVLLSAGAALGFGLSSNVARKLFRLPVDWFARRHVGDILSRFQSVIPIRQMLAEEAPSAIVDGALIILTLSLMFFYSTVLSLISLAALAIFVALRAFLFPYQRAAQEQMIVASGREQSILIESLRGMRALRLSGRESLRHALWQSRMTDAVNGNVRFQRLENWQTTAHQAIFGLENVLIVWFSVSSVMRGGFTVGMIFAFLAYKTQFLTVGATLVDKIVAFRMLSLHLDRLSEIAQADDDISFLANRSAETPLRGEIELQGVHYRYGPDDPMVLRGVDLRVGQGESIAITGPSGGGKSTLVQILLGLVEPTAGRVLVDGMELRSFGYKNFQRQIAAVLQDDTLFAGSIADNIAMFDEAPDLHRIKEVAGAAAIRSDIEAMVMGYDTLVGDMGAALSGGQRQRLLLARALYRDPKLIILDEGTSHLDEALEKAVNAAISDLRITRIIVAHRQETIASADRVVVLDEGILRPVGARTS